MDDLKYSAVLAITTPFVCYYNGIVPMKSQLMYRIFLEQFLLRNVQLKSAKYIKNESGNNWIGFAMIGSMQSVCYGHVVSRMAGLSPTFGLRGIPFGITRDIISQGIPYHLANKKTEMIAYTIVFTACSHVLHNLQIVMQSNAVSYYESIDIALKTGTPFIYRGLSGRMILLTITNIMNYWYY